MDIASSKMERPLLEFCEASLFLPKLDRISCFEKLPSNFPAFLAPTVLLPPPAHRTCKRRASRGASPKAQRFQGVARPLRACAVRKVYTLHGKLCAPRPSKRVQAACQRPKAQWFQGVRARGRISPFPVAWENIFLYIIFS